MKISKQNINGQELDVYDEGAVRYDEAQTLTPQQRDQARENVGAASKYGVSNNFSMQRHDIEEVKELRFAPPGDSDIVAGIHLSDSEIYPSGETSSVVSFSSILGDVILRSVANGTQDNDAATVGQVKNAVKFVRLAETVLTEDTVEIVWTQTQDGKPLSDYKDFFVYWTGKFTADVSTTHATNSRFQCKGNGGTSYFSCQFPKKISTENYAGWFYIEEIINDGKFALWRSQFPNAFLRTGNGANIDYRVQGLIDACQTTVTDICCITNPAHTTLQSLHLGNVAESTSIFAAGTKAILLGRARQ